MSQYFPESRKGRGLLAVIVLALIALGTCGYVAFAPGTSDAPSVAWLIGES